VAGWTVVGGFGLSGPRLAESLLYLRPWDEHRCAFAPIETINNRDLKKKKEKKKKSSKIFKVVAPFFIEPMKCKFDFPVVAMGERDPGHEQVPW